MSETTARLIHFIWLGPRPLPASFESILPRWRELNPGFEVRLWTETDLEGLQLVNKEVIANTSLNPGLRADFLRLELLYAFGGVYADVDMTCEQPIEPLVQMAGGRFAIGISNTRVLEVNNGVMLSSKGHPFL